MTRAEAEQRARGIVDEWDRPLYEEPSPNDLDRLQETITSALLDAEKRALEEAANRAAQLECRADHCGMDDWRCDTCRLPDAIRALAEAKEGA